MDPNLHNLKNFLLVYNKITEVCFERCVDNLFTRDLNTTESQCAERCVDKFARFNQKMMSVYVEVQSEINNKRMKELEDNQKKLLEQQSTTSAVTTPALEGAATSQQQAFA